MSKKLIFETKPLTLSQRIDVNNVTSQIDNKTGNIIISDMFAIQVKYLKYGLKSVNNVLVEETTFDKIVNELTNEEINTISDMISTMTNFPKKK